MAKSKNRKNHKKKVQKRRERIKNNRNFQKNMMKDFLSFARKKINNETQSQLPDTFSKEDIDKLKEEEEE